MNEIGLSRKSFKKAYFDLMSLGDVAYYTTFLNIHNWTSANKISKNLVVKKSS